jgi:hypothetical protein
MRKRSRMLPTKWWMIRRKSSRKVQEGVAPVRKGGDVPAFSRESKEIVK